ncbi:hypothetical protein ACIQWV_04865 [Streptomyces sp. NPDC098085]|uniref:hypothetical protein n=1 Tax=Streptomyces sp. NPDC098085 TaxID=3366094 RepID=UPI00382ACDC5
MNLTVHQMCAERTAEWAVEYYARRVVGWAVECAAGWRSGGGRVDRRVAAGRLPGCAALGISKIHP